MSEYPVHSGRRTAKHRLTAEQLALVAERFKVLAEPVRLQLLQKLMMGESTVGELAMKAGLSQANVSKHLQLLLAHDLVTRRKEGLFAYYQLADETVFQLCELVCRRLESSSRERQRQLLR